MSVVSDISATTETMRIGPFEFTPTSLIVDGNPEFDKTITVK